MKCHNSNFQNQKYWHIEIPTYLNTSSKWYKNHCDNMCNIFKGENRENTEQTSYVCCEN